MDEADDQGVRCRSRSMISDFVSIMPRQRDRGDALRLLLVYEGPLTAST